MAARVFLLALLLLGRFFLLFKLPGAGAARLVCRAGRMGRRTFSFEVLSHLWTRLVVVTGKPPRVCGYLCSNNCFDDEHLCSVDREPALNRMFVLLSAFFPMLLEGFPKNFTTADVGPLLAGIFVTFGCLVSLLVEIR